MVQENPTSAESPPDAERRLVNAAWAQFERIKASSSAKGHFSPSPSFQLPGYRILTEIHRGGQGVVFQAIQESTRRKVAVKVLKEGPFADRVELARFEREVDVLSRLDHPHIVGIHDRGLTSGHAYYVMDYVAGHSLDAYVAAAGLSIDEVLHLFVKICDAVNVAHLRGVIHRDLKPANIRIDENGEPRILDFGLAKLAHTATRGFGGVAALDQTQTPTMTMAGQFVGSLPWSSPEQVEGGSDLVDIRCDVYALGVILYQLVTRRFPYPVAGRIDDVVRHILHTDPARPSSIRRELDFDLELVILKCLAKEPQRRYQSAGELARDIRHYLAHEPVSATSPSTAYRLRKFVQRNRGAVLAGSVAAIALLAASGVSLKFGLSEARQRKIAEAAETEAKLRAAELEQVAEFQQKQLSGIDAEAMGVRLRADLLERARTAAERAMLPPEEVEARVSELERLIGDNDFTGLALQALENNFFQPTFAAIDEQFSGQPLVQARLLNTLAETLYGLGLLDAAIAPQEEALAIRRSVLGDDRPDTLTSIQNMGFLFNAQGKLDQAEPYCREALEKSRHVLGEAHPFTMGSISIMGSLLQAQGKLDQAEPYFRDALEKRRRVMGDEHPETLRAINALGVLLRVQGKLDQAEPYYREALEKRRRVLGDEHRDTLRSINNMGVLLQAQGDLDEAEAFCREALERRRRVLGDEHPDTLNSIENMGSLLQERGYLDQAEPYHREALEKKRRVLGDEHRDTLVSIISMGLLLQTQGKTHDALALLAPAEPAARRAFTGGHAVRLGRFLTALGRARADIADFEEAEANLSDAHAILSDAKGARDRDYTEVLRGLVELYDAWHAAEPEQGHDLPATEWRAKLVEWQSSIQPALP